MSDWLRRAKIEALQRDPVDALNDAEALVRFAQARLNAVLRHAPNSGDERQTSVKRP